MAETGKRECLRRRWAAMGRGERLVLRAYFGLMRVIPESLAVALARRRARTRPGEENAERAPERVARGMPRRPEGRVVWLHSIGPGDSTANLTLARALLGEAADLTCLITTRTAEGQKVFARLAEESDGRVIVMLAPLDLYRATRRFLDHWRFDLAIYGEGDMWPNALRGLAAAGVPVALVNGQFNGRLGRLVGRRPVPGRWAMAHFDLLHVFRGECVEEAGNWVRPGCEVVHHPNLKMDAPAPRIDDALLGEMRARWGDAPVFVCGSVADNEIDTLLDAFCRARQAVPGMKLILVPRWKEQGETIAATARARGWTVPRRAVEGLPGAEDPLFIADSYGEMGTWFEMAFGVFMGHTLFGGIGHNPYEAIARQRPILSGSITPLLPADYTYLVDMGLCRITPDAESIARGMIDYHQAMQEGDDRFAAFRAAQGFSHDLARRLLALMTDRPG
ncbi:MAG: 3-deoxy-D-manno-octulosonic-acid transferase [Rhodobacteraceae bacterium HLUCCO07]|nr:MAG: 3-deoxy-D-manno-octulosonic-acid transferase [Rhodobacteraceae bacterium HLUCCO07]